MRNEQRINCVSDYINSNSFLLDTQLLKHVKEAEIGCLDSQIALAEAFGCGVGAKKDPELAAYYERKIYESTVDDRIKLAALWNLAIREKEKGNYEAMKEKFQVVIDFMRENMPMEDWDFSLFNFMETYTQSDQ